MASNPYRAMREAAGISLREVARRTGWAEGASTQPPGSINPGRLSLIERGIEPDDNERMTLNHLLGDLLAGGTK